MSTVIGWGVLIVAAFVGTVLSQTPTVTIRQSDPTSHGTTIVAQQDHDVTMDCYVENLPVETTVRWSKTTVGKNGTTSTLPLSQDMALEDNILYSIERPTQFTWKFRIRAIQVSNEGTYTCFVQTTLNSRAEDRRTIQVVSKPILDPQRTSSDVSADQGEDIDLSCNSTGRPFPTVEWSRLGGALLPIGQEKLQGFILPLHNIKPDDRGVYRCTATNSVGTDQTDIKVDVRFQPIIEVPRPVVYQAVGYRVELQCYGEGNPVPKAQDSIWTKDAMTYTTSSDAYQVNFVQGAFGRVRFELIIHSVQESNFGTYTCRMKNSKGSSTGSITLVKTMEPQASVKLGKVVAGASTPKSWSLLLMSVLTVAFCLVKFLD